jgi:endonuclease III
MIKTCAGRAADCHTTNTNLTSGDTQNPNMGLPAPLLLFLEGNFMNLELSTDQKQIINILTERGYANLHGRREKVRFTGNTDADDLLDDISGHPHAFVLGCVMDQQTKADHAWAIPYRFGCALKDFKFESLTKLDQEWVRTFFIQNGLHRFPDRMSDYFYHAIQTIDQKYQGDAAKIWAGTPTSATVVHRFREFRGIGPKISTMAVNVLLKVFKVPFADTTGIDISSDVHVRRVFARLGLVDEGASNDEVIYRARGLNPEYPGIFDEVVWEVGVDWCRPSNPRCAECCLNEYCPRIGVG